MKQFPALPTSDPKKLRNLGIGVLLVATLIMVGWVSAVQLFTIQQRQSQIQRTVGLERQIRQLRSHYLEENPEALDDELRQATQLIMTDHTHVAQWAQGLQEMASQWNLLLDYRFVTIDRAASPLQGIAVIPMEIQVHGEGTQSAYSHYLQFIKALTRSGTKVEIRKLSITGDGHKATHLTIGCSVWMKIPDSIEL